MISISTVPIHGRFEAMSALRLGYGQAELRAHPLRPGDARRKTQMRVMDGGKVIGNLDEIYICSYLSMSISCRR